MPRLNDKTKTEKDFIRWELRQRDGDGSRAGTLCFIDGCMNEELYQGKTGKDFDICHLDDNPNNWDMQNLFLAAHKCNVQMTPHGKIDHAKNYENICNALKAKRMKSVCTDIYISEEGGLRVRSAELKRSLELKPLAIAEFQRVIEEKEQVEKKGLIDSMAFVSGLSQIICETYVRQLTNPHSGDYEEIPKDGDEKKYIRKRQ